MTHMNELVGTQLACGERIQTWRAGEVLFHEGEQPRGVYIIHSGRVDLLFSTRDGVSKALRSKRTGDMIGLSEIISGTPYDCTATTHASSRIGFVPTAELHTMLEQNPSLWLEIAARMSVEIGSCWDSMRSLGALR